MELTNSLIKTIKSLGEPKGRKAEGAFKAEGAKCVRDTVGSFSVRWLVATPEWIDANRELARRHGDRLIKAAPRDMERLSSFQSPPPVVAVYDIPEPTVPDLDGGLIVALDSIQDPGNLGTIIRTCDWFGVHRIICSPDTADVFNPKVVQSTMGAIARVRMWRTDLRDALAGLPEGMPVYGTFLDGESIYDADLSTDAVVVFGNEGRGISPEVAKCVNGRIFIPPFPGGEITSESLNVGAAAAITMSQFRMRMR